MAAAAPALAPGRRESVPGRPWPVTGAGNAMERPETTLLAFAVSAETVAGIVFIFIIKCNVTASKERKGPNGKPICPEFKLAGPSTADSTMAAAQKYSPNRAIIIGTIFYSKKSFPRGMQANSDLPIEAV